MTQAPELVWWLATFTCQVSSCSPGITHMHTHMHTCTHTHTHTHIGLHRFTLANDKDRALCMSCRTFVAEIPCHFVRRAHTMLLKNWHQKEFCVTSASANQNAASIILMLLMLRGPFALHPGPSKNDTHRWGDPTKCHTNADRHILTMIFTLLRPTTTQV